MRNHLRVKGSYGLTATILGIVVVLAVITGISATSLVAADDEPTPTPTESDAGDATPSNGPVEAAYAEDLPSACSDGARGCSFRNQNLALVSSDPVRFIDERTAVVTGEVVIPTNGVDIEIDNADLEIVVGTEGEVASVSGTSDVPLPTVGPLAAAAVIDGARAEIGYDWGRNLGHLGVPVQPDRQYFYFTFEDSFAMRTGFDEVFGDIAGLPLTLSTPGDVSATMVIDPLDPFLYIGGACPDFGSDNEADRDDRSASDDASDSKPDETAEVAYGAGPGEDCGLGISLGGHIPFEARIDGDTGSEISAFDGHILIHHSEIPVTTGVSLDGEMVVRVATETLAFGGNGQIRASVPLIDDVVDLSFPLADASTGMELDLSTGAEQVDLFLAGRMDSQTAFDQLPAWVPLEAPNDAHVEARARLVLNLRSGPLVDPASFVELSGQVALTPSFLSDLTGVDLSQLLVSEAKVRFDASGLRMQATTSSSIHPAIELGGEVAVDAVISPADPRSSYVTLDGDVRIAAIDLDGSASLRLDSTGFTVAGTLHTPVSEIELAGAITTTDVSLTGRARVEVPLNLLGGLLEGAPEKLAAAKADVGEIDDEIARLRAEIEADRAQRTKSFDAAKAEVDAAKAEVDKIQRDIDGAHTGIRRLESEIDDWEAWYENLTGVEQATYGWAQLGAEVGWRKAEIGVIFTGIGGMEAARFLAQGVLDGAILALDAIEAGLDLIPVDADPRIIALTASRDIALAALSLAETAAEVLTFDARLAAEIEVELGTTGLGGAVTGQVCSGTGCLDLVGGQVAFDPTPEACVTVAGANACFGF